MSILIGIDAIELVGSHHVLDLADLAQARGIDPAKYTIGLGQDAMGVLAPDEDAVTLGAAAAARLLARTGVEGIRELLFATESGVDQSKSGGMFVHGLLGLPTNMRVAEVKQACYAGTIALQQGLNLIARDPEAKVLVIMSDVARYELGSPGEPTQGAAAVAVLLSAHPRLLAIEPAAGVYSADVDDFWRPNDRSTAMVDGALSLRAYLDALVGSWRDYRARGGEPAEQIDRFLYHQPFTKMAVKGHRRLAEYTGVPLDEGLLDASFVYNRMLGNSYGASLYAALVSLLHHGGDLTGRRIGFFSYGSGSVGEFFAGVVQPGYRAVLAGVPGATGARVPRFSLSADGETSAAVDNVGSREDGAAAPTFEDAVAALGAELAARTPLTVPEYEALHRDTIGSDTDRELPRVTRAPFRLAAVRGGARVYERTRDAEHSATQRE